VHSPAPAVWYEHSPGGSDLLEPGRQVRGIANSCVVHAQIVANASDHDHARVEPHPDRAFDTVGAAEVRMLLLQGALQLKRRQHRAAGVIFVSQRRAKQGHEAITETLINGAFIAMYRIQSQSKRLRGHCAR
jgi:hypothetical protein